MYYLVALLPQPEMKLLPLIPRAAGCWTFWLATFLTLVGGLFLQGCGAKPAPKLTASEQHAFDSASPTLAQMWQTALVAGSSNDYVTAQTLLYGLSRTDLTPEQTEAVGKEITALKQRLNAAAQKADPAALKALEELRQNSVRRRATGE